VKWVDAVAQLLSRLVMLWATERIIERRMIRKLVLALGELAAIISRNGSCKDRFTEVERSVGLQGS
jgi:hypothetical protein